MRSIHLSALGLAAVVAGCAAAVPGYVPSTPLRERMLAAQQTGGGFNEDGSYRLTDQEQELDCKHLNGSITVKIIQMRNAGDRKEPTTLAQTAQKTLQPIKGGTSYGIDTREDYRRDRARLEGLNKQLASKGCRTFDLDRELAPGNTATPAPTSTDTRRKEG
jgi:hypothetical protein